MKHVWGFVPVWQVLIMCQLGWNLLFLRGVAKCYAFSIFVHGYKLKLHKKLLTANNFMLLDMFHSVVYVKQPIWHFAGLEVLKYGIFTFGGIILLLYSRGLHVNSDGANFFLVLLWMYNICVPLPVLDRILLQMRFFLFFISMGFSWWNKSWIIIIKK